MSFGTGYATPFFTGSSLSSEVPSRFHCSLAGRGYMIDTARLEDFTRRSIPLLRQQADSSDAPGEATLSPEELWRRSQDSWDHGAGQTYLDRGDSDNRRFRTSKGVDVWERWALQLLPDTTQARSSANTNLRLATAGSRLYALDGTALVYTTNLSAFTTVTGTPGAATSIASDGFSVFTAHGASGIYSTNTGTGAAASMTTGTVSLVGYVKGRLMAANANSLYNVTSFTVAALPAALYTHPNTGFTWVGFAEGQAAIYAAGYAGDKSLIYRIALKPDGTALDVPVVAGELPDGEIVRSIGGYLGYVLLGTDKGVRFCSTNSDASLTIGSLIPTGAAVQCFEGQDRFVWYGLTNYDATSTGLGRMDLQTFTFTLTPAYASDLMVTGQGAVLDVVTFLNKRVLAVSGLGFYTQSTNKVASGILDSGLITFGLPDLKTAVKLDVKVREAVDTNRAYISVDGGAFTLVGTRSSAEVDPFIVGEQSGETFEVRHELLNADVDLTAGPVITRYTLRAYPRPAQGEIFTVPVLLHEKVKTRTNDYFQRPDAELSLLLGYRETKELLAFQIGSEAHTVLVDDAIFAYSHLTTSGTAWNGTALLRLKSPAN